MYEKYEGQTQAVAPWHGTKGAMANDVAVPRQTEVEAENKRLAHTVEQLCMLVDSLTDRLIPVRRKTGGLNSNKEASAPEPVLCELAATARARRQSIEHAIGVLQTSLNELEI